VGGSFVEKARIGQLRHALSVPWSPSRQSPFA
jgi:hypothetical protein